MADKAMGVYLNDHLAGAMLGTHLAEQIRSHNQGTPLGELMGSLTPQIEEDRQTHRLQFGVGVRSTQGLVILENLLDDLTVHALCLTSAPQV